MRLKGIVTPSADSLTLAPVEVVNVGDFCILAVSMILFPTSVWATSLGPTAIAPSESLTGVRYSTTFSRCLETVLPATVCLTVRRLALAIASLTCGTTSSANPVRKASAIAEHGYQGREP